MPRHADAVPEARMRRRISYLAALLLGACSSTPPPAVPMASDALHADRRAGTLLVMLPGRGDRGRDFRAHGFLETGREPGFDVLAADAHFGYYVARTVVERLHRDIVQPARARGYDRIWLLGISAGGLGATLYARAYPAMVDGLILLAPYPGDAELVAEIAAAGGLGAWTGESTAGAAYQRRSWQWLQQATAPPDPFPIVLGYGRDDRFAAANELLARRLPAERVFTAGGGHRWPVWAALWQRIAAAGFPVTDGMPGMASSGHRRPR